jgi:hypothetical protein
LFCRIRDSSSDLSGEVSAWISLKYRLPNTSNGVVMGTRPVNSLDMRLVSDVYAMFMRRPCRSGARSDLRPGRIHNTQGDLSIFLCVVVTHLSQVGKCASNAAFVRLVATKTAESVVTTLCLRSPDVEPGLWTHHPKRGKIALSSLFDFVPSAREAREPMLTRLGPVLRRERGTD